MCRHVCILLHVHFVFFLTFKNFIDKRRSPRKRPPSVLENSNNGDESRVHAGGSAVQRKCYRIISAFISVLMCVTDEGEGEKTEDKEGHTLGEKRPRSRADGKYRT